MLFIMSCPKETMTSGVFVMQNIEDFYKMLSVNIAQNCTEMAYNNDIINDIDNEISFLAIHVT